MKNYALLLSISVIFIVTAGFMQDGASPYKHLTPEGVIRAGDEHRTRGKLDKAIEAYDFAIQQAGNKQGKEKSLITAKALFRKALCYEAMDPPNVQQALDMYGQISSTCSDITPAEMGANVVADDKVKMKGVDIYLNYFRKTVTGMNNIEEIRKKETETWEKIQPLDKDAIPGLLFTLFGSDDESTWKLAGKMLSKVVDEQGIALTVAKLADPSIDVRNAAKFALGRIVEIYLGAKKFDEEALKIEANVQEFPVNNPEMVLNEATKLHAKATELRHNIPASIATESIMGAVEKVLSNKELSPDRKIYAAGVIEDMKEASPKVEDVLIDHLREKDISLRAQCAKSLGAIKSRKAIKHFEELLVYNPELDNDPAKPKDLANTEKVRRDIAEALGNIGCVGPIPSLIAALDDDKVMVRSSAGVALERITEKRDILFYPDAAPETRKKAIDLWKKWWEETNGIPILIERFRKFEQQWLKFRPEHLSNEKDFIRRVERDIKTKKSAPETKDIAIKAFATYNGEQQRHIRDIVEIGDSALPHLMKYIGGEFTSASTADPAIRIFVAETMAKMAENGSKSALDLLRKCASGGADSTPTKRAGAILALGRLPAAMLAPEDVAAIQQGLSSGAPETIISAAEAVIRQKLDQSVSQLADALPSAPTDDSQLAVILALIDLNKKEKAPVNNLTTLIKNTKNSDVKEYAIDALGVTEDIDALPALLVTRISYEQAIVDASVRAIVRLPKDEAAKKLIDLLKEKSPQSRAAAALLLGDIAAQEASRYLLNLLIDEKPPKLRKDSDTLVRQSAAEALIKIKHKRREIVSGLIVALGDPDGKVRANAYEALKATTEGTIAFDPGGKEKDRNDAIKSWNQWFAANASKFPQD